MHTMSRQEKMFLWIWNMVLLLIVFTPHIIAFLHTLPGLHFTYLPEPEVDDLNAYFAWIRQASEGRWLFTDLFTTETSSGFFHPVFLLMGKLVQLGFPLGLVWYGVRIAANSFFVFALYKFLVTILPEVRQRFWSLILITLGGGFGWILGNLSADSAQTEATILQSLRWPFIYALGMALLVLAFNNTYLLLKTKQIKHAWWGGLWGLLLAFIHLYDIVIFYPVILSIAGIYILRNRDWWNLRSICKLAPLLALPIPGLVYYFILFTHDWIFLANTQFVMHGRGFVYYLLSFGTLPLLAIVGVCIFYKNKRSRESLWLLLIWILAQGILILTPISFQRKLLMGLIIPIGTLAGIGMSYVMDRLIRTHIEPLLKIAVTVVVVLMVGMSIPINAMVLSRDIRNAQSRSMPYFLSSRILNSFEWLDLNVGDEAVIASPAMGNLIPRFTGLQVYAGHWAQTINASTKYPTIDYFYSGKIDIERNMAFLAANNLRYVYYGPVEQYYYPNNWMEYYPDKFKKVYEQEGIIIYARI